MGVLCCYFRPKIFSGDHVRYHSHTLGAHVLATVVGPSPNGPRFCHIRYIRPGGVTPVDHVEVVWAKSARGVWGLGQVFDGKLYFTRDICEEKWIPKDLVPRKKSLAAPKARAKAAPQPRAKSAAKRTGLALQAGAKVAAKPAPHAIASSSSASATHSVLVMQTEHVQQFKVCHSRTQKPRSSLPFLWILNNIYVG